MQIEVACEILLPSNGAHLAEVAERNVHLSVQNHTPELYELHLQSSRVDRPRFCKTALLVALLLCLQRIMKFVIV